MGLRVAVVGAGLMGGHHARNLAALPEVQLVAVVDPDRPRAEALAASVGAEPLFEVGALAGRVDAAIVATPAELHAPVARHLLEQGVHLLVEKPLATQLEDAAELYALAARRGLVLQVGHLLRFHAGFQALATLAPAPRRVLARRIVPGARDVGVSVLMDLMVHDLDLALRLVGEYPSACSARGLGEAGREDEVEVELAFPSGASASLLASRVRPGAERSLLAEGEGGSARLDFLEPASLSVERAGQMRSNTSFPAVNPLRAQLSAFVERVRLGSGAPEPAAELALLELAFTLQSALGSPRQAVTAPDRRSPIM